MSAAGRRSPRRRSGRGRSPPSPRAARTRRASRPGRRGRRGTRSRRAWRRRSWRRSVKISPGLRRASRRAARGRPRSVLPCACSASASSGSRNVRARSTAGRAGSGSDDHLDGAAVDAPGRAERRRRRARSRGRRSPRRSRRPRRGGRSAGSAPAASRPSSRLGRRRCSSTDWSSRPPGSIQSSDLTGPGADRVDEHAGARVAVGEEARERELGGLGDRVLAASAGRRALAGGRGDVDDAAPAALGHRRERLAHQPHRRHHVELPGGVPVVVGHVVEVAPRRRAGVVDDHVDLAEALLGRGDDAAPASGSVTSSGQVGGATVGDRSGPAAFGGRLGDLRLGPGDEQHLSRPPRRASAPSRGRSRGRRR